MVARAAMIVARAAMIVAIGEESMTAKITTGSQATIVKIVLKPGALRSVDMPNDSVVTKLAESAAIGIDDTAAANSPTLKQKYQN